MKRGVKSIIAGGTLFALGICVFPPLVVIAIVLGEPPDTQFKVPGRIQIPIDEPGRYYLWNAYETVHEGKTYLQSERLLGTYQITVRDREGQLLDFVGDASASSSNLKTSKRSLGYVEVESVGSIDVEVSGGPQERVFSIGQFHVLQIVARAFVGVGVSVLIAFGGLCLLIWGIVKFVRADKTKGVRIPVGTN